MSAQTPTDTSLSSSKKGTIQSLFSAGAHFGYSKARRHPSMRDLIFGSKDRVEIFDLEKTSKLLEDALLYVEQLGKEGKSVILVGGKPEVSRIVRETAEELSIPYVASRWLGGTLTNFSEIKRRIGRLSELTADRDTGALLKKYTKKERLMIDREIARLEANFGGLAGVTRLPDALMVIDTRHEHIAVAEANLMKIPVVAVMNSDCDMSKVAYPIVGNDASIESVQFFLSALAEAFKKGRRVAAPAPVETTVSESVVG